MHLAFSLPANIVVLLLREDKASRRACSSGEIDVVVVDVVDAGGTTCAGLAGCTALVSAVEIVGGRAGRHEATSAELAEFLWLSILSWMADMLDIKLSSLDRRSEFSS